MIYSIIEEASEAVIGYYTDNLEEAIADIPPYGKYLIVDENDVIIYDSQPGITYKI